MQTWKWLPRQSGSLSRHKVQTVGTWVGLDLEPRPGAQGRGGYSEVVIDVAEDLVPSLGAAGKVSRGEWGWGVRTQPTGSFWSDWSAHVLGQDRATLLLCHFFQEDKLTKLISNKPSCTSFRLKRRGGRHVCDRVRVAFTDFQHTAHSGENSGYSSQTPVFPSLQMCCAFPPFILGKLRRGMCLPVTCGWFLVRNHPPRLTCCFPPSQRARAPVVGPVGWDLLTR